MIVNFSHRLCFYLIKRMPNLEKLLSNQELINRTLNSLQKEVSEIEKLFDQCKGAKTSTNLEKENASLELEINKMKAELIRLETLRGIAQIPIPSRNLKCDQTSETAIPEQGKVQPVVKSGETEENKQSKKEAKKKEKASTDKQPDKKEAPAEAAVDVSRLDIRIGKIIDTRKHPDADALYVSDVDVGKDKTITVVSGLVKHFKAEEIKGRTVVLLCNLKPVKMRGVTSEAMVMCASTPEKVEILIPPPGSQPGDIVEVVGYPPAPDSVLNPKKKIFETVSPDLKTDDSLQATYKGNPFMVKNKGIVTTVSLKGVNIK